MGELAWGFCSEYEKCGETLLVPFTRRDGESLRAVPGHILDHHDGSVEWLIPCACSCCSPIFLPVHDEDHI